MRDYSKVSPNFWIGDTGKRLRAAGPEAQIVAMYLMTSPHANMLGLYYCPVTFIAHETGLPFEGASKGLQRVVEAGFCLYDEGSDMVWVVEMAAYQIGQSLKPADLRVKGVQSHYDSLIENPFLEPFYEKYGEAFCMTSCRGTTSGVEAPSKALLSQEQEQEKEKEKEPREPDGIARPSRDETENSKLKGPPAKDRKITFTAFCNVCRDHNETLLKDYDPLWSYAESVRVETEWIAVAWWRFKDRYSNDANYSQKRYVDWRQTFLNACRYNWFKFWTLPSGSDAVPTLTSDGRLALAEFRAVSQKVTT